MKGRGHGKGEEEEEENLENQDASSGRKKRKKKDPGRRTYSIGTKSLVKMAPSVMAPPAPSPQTALAATKLPILPARAHHAVAAAKTSRLATKRGLRPTASESRPRRGWEAVVVRRKAVESQEAALAAAKWEVMTGWEEARSVPSKEARNWAVRIWPKMRRKRVGWVEERRR
jgi:hypothetical protein